MTLCDDLLVSTSRHAPTGLDHTVNVLVSRMDLIPRHVLWANMIYGPSGSACTGKPASHRVFELDIVGKETTGSRQKKLVSLNLFPPD